MRTFLFVFFIVSCVFYGNNIEHSVCGIRFDRHQYITTGAVTSVNLNPSMNKLSHTLQKLLIYSQTSNVQPLNFGNGKVFHPTPYDRCDYLCMLGSKLIHVNKGGPMNLRWKIILGEAIINIDIHATCNHKLVPWWSTKPAYKQCNIQEITL